MESVRDCSRFLTLKEVASRVLAMVMMAKVMVMPINSSSKEKPRSLRFELRRCCFTLCPFVDENLSRSQVWSDTGAGSNRYESNAAKYACYAGKDRISCGRHLHRNGFL